MNLSSNQINLIKDFFSKQPVLKAYLFGSYSQGNETENSDIDLLVDVARRIEGNTICPLGDAAAWPVAAAVRHFRHEFEHHVKFPEKVKDPKHGHHEPIMPVAPAMVNA